MINNKNSHLKTLSITGGELSKKVCPKLRNKVDATNEGGEMVGGRKAISKPSDITSNPSGSCLPL